MTEHSMEPFDLIPLEGGSEMFPHSESELECGISMEFPGEIVIGDGEMYIAGVPWTHGEDELEGNARRLVACWNALRGLNPEVVPELVAALDDLADYAEGAYDEGYFDANEQSDGMQASIKKARELLARVKGA